MRTLVLLSLLLTAPLAAETIRVPQDQATVQAALNAASNGDTVLISSGVYTETLTLTGKDDVTIRGKGAVQLRHATQTIQGKALTIDDCERTTLVGLRFVPNGPTSGLEVLGSNAVLIASCRFDDLKNGLILDDVEGARVVSCRFTANETAVLLRDCVGVDVTRCDLRDLVNFGVFIDDGESMIVRRCSLRDVGATGIRVTDASRGVLIEGNKLRDVSTGVFTEGDAMVVRDNSFTGGFDAIEITFESSSGGHVVSGNRIKKITDRAIFVTSSETIVVGNQIKTTGGDGVRLDTSGALVADNVVTGAGGDGVRASGSRHTLVGNRIRKSGGQSINASVGAANLIDNDVDDA